MTHLRSVFPLTYCVEEGFLLTSSGIVRSVDLPGREPWEPNTNDSVHASLVSLVIILFAGTGVNPSFSGSPSRLSYGTS